MGRGCMCLSHVITKLVNMKDFRTPRALTNVIYIRWHWYCGGTGPSAPQRDQKVFPVSRTRKDVV